MNPYDLRGPEFLGLYLLVLVGAAALALALRRALRGPGGNPGPRHLDLGVVETALLAGGPARAFEAAVARLTAAGALEVDAFGRSLAPRGAAPSQASSVERATLEAVGSAPGQSIDRVRGRAAAAVAIAEARVAGMGLRPGSLATRALPALTVGAAAAFGGGKILVGLSRGRPVGLLALLVAAASALAIGLALRGPARSRRGDAVLERLRARHRGLEKVGRGARDAAPSDVALAVALFGLDALQDSSLAHVRLALRPPPAPATSGSSGCGGSSCGSSGCGGGGGGCGGCGS